MLQHVLNRQYDPDKYQSANIFNIAKGNESLLQRMSLLRTLDVHRGCVNTVVWDQTGNWLLSGSDDQHLVITDPWTGRVANRIHTAHRANIFSAKFLPQSSNQKIVSCSGDGVLIYTDLERLEETHDCKFTCHVSTCYDIITLPDDPHTFLSCGEDGTVRWFDLRVKDRCSAPNCQQDILLNMGAVRPVTAIAVHPITAFQLTVATQDSTIRIYDRRMLGTQATDSYLEDTEQALLMRLKPDGLESKQHRVTSLRYSHDGHQILASYSQDYMYLFDTQTYKEVPLEAKVEDDDNGNSEGPTLKRLRLRGDWSDTGPQALPESEMRNQPSGAGVDVGQARPTLHATLMQRMTDVLSRMLNDPGPRPAAPAAATADGREETSNQSDEQSTSQSQVEVEASVVSDAAALDDHQYGRTSSQPISQEPVEPTLQDPVEESLSSNTMADQDVVMTEPRHETKDSQAAHEKPAGECTVTASTSTVQPAAVREDSIAMEVDNTEWNENENREMEEAGAMEGLEDRISSMRQGFVDRHRVEPSVNLTYSGLGVSSSVISMGVADEMSRGASLNTEQDQPVAASSSITRHNAGNDGGPIAASGYSAPPSTTSSGVNSSLSENNQGSADNESPNFPSSFVVVSNHEFGVQESPQRLGGAALDYGEERPSTSSQLVSAIEKAEQHCRKARGGEKKVTGDLTVPQATVKQCYKGHRNARTMIKEASFWGLDHVMSGSDCGRVFVWERSTGRLVMMWEADRHVVNCLQPHPTLPVLATSGIDYDVKLWSPSCKTDCETHFDEEKAQEVTRVNEALLEETRDTITVPATFMIRMLASLNQIRRGSSFAERWRNRPNRGQRRSGNNNGSEAADDTEEALEDGGGGGAGDGDGDGDGEGEDGGPPLGEGQGQGEGGEEDSQLRTPGNESDNNAADTMDPDIDE